MNDDLIAELWARALAEGEGVSGTGRLMAQLVAEECAKICDGESSFGYGYEAQECAKTIREKFGLLKT